MSVSNWEEVYRVQTARIAELEATLDEITAANGRATKRWQAAHPGKELVIPDQAKMVEWLLEQVAKFDDPHRLHAHCVRYLTDAQVAHLFGERMTEIVNSRDKLEAENAELRKDKERLENYIAKQMHNLEVENTGQEVKIEQLEAENAELRKLLYEPYKFFRFGHKALKPWGKALDDWCEMAEQFGFKKEAQP